MKLRMLEEELREEEEMSRLELEVLDEENCRQIGKQIGGNRIGRCYI